jgi:hypothetical protein
MKSYRCKIKKNTYILGYEFHRSLPTLLRGCLCICISAFLVSCATVPQQAYLTNASLSNMKKVAIVCSVSAPEVSYSINSQGSGVGVWFGFLGMEVERAIRSDIDKEHAKEIGNHLDLSRIENKIAKSFIQQLNKSDCFQTVEYVGDKNQDVRLSSLAGYDALIRLNVREISISRDAGDYVKLYVYMHGQLEHLTSGKIVWDREEVVSSPERHTLDYYKENGLKELDAILEKAGKNLSYDFIYLK